MAYPRLIGDTEPSQPVESELGGGLVRSYLDLVVDVLENGVRKGDRTGTGTRALFGRQIRFDLESGFPLLTTKKVHLKSVIHELLWFISGETNVRPLQQAGVRIWDEWADPETGDLGPIYGAQWRNWEGPEGTVVDQLGQVINEIKTNPDSRRLIVSAWNVALIEKMALPPCHCLFQFQVLEGRLHCQLYQRSADLFLGVPFNIGSTALLTYLLAHHTGLKPKKIVIVIGDAHIYEQHLDSVQKQLMREPLEFPTLRILGSPKKNIEDYVADDIILEDYKSLSRISAPMIP